MVTISRASVARFTNVAISVLSGEVKVVAATAVKEAVAAWAAADSRGVSTALREELQTWAEQHDVSDATFDAAWPIAESLFRDFPATLDEILDASLDPERLARQKVQHAKSRYIVRREGKAIYQADGSPVLVDDDVREVSERIAVIFYQELIADPKLRTALNEAAIHQVYRRDRAKHEADRRAEEDRSARRRQSLERYLKALIADLSTDIWPRAQGEAVLSVTDLERSLRVKTDATGEARSADEIAETCDHLVILGGPGAGKTWLAWRIARRSAQRALDQLSVGTHIDDIEVPLLLTCEQFQTAPAANPRAAAVNPALDQRSDFGVTDELKDLLQRRERGVLLILDSLDEAKPGSRGIEKAVIGSWRMVVTSRPAAWQNHWDVVEPMTTTLEPLDYEADVVPFARTWFASRDRDGGTALAEGFLDQLRVNPIARTLSTTPLFLTLLCLVGDEPLPRTRGGLLDTVVNRLLEWRATKLNLHAELPDLLVLARQWAWEAAEDDPATGLSRWSEEFVPKPPTVNSGVLDTIAPATSAPRPGTGGQVSRRFVHRSIREHLVATHLQTLSVEEAARQLALHWYADDTWAEIIPTAIARHPHRDTLLGLLRDGPSIAMAKLEQEVLATTTSHLLGICADSKPVDWNSSNQQLLHDLRASKATEEAGRIALSSHWSASNSEAVRALIAHLPSAGYLPGPAARALVDLDPSEPTRRRAVRVLTDDLPNAGPRMVAVARALVDLDPSEPTRKWTVQVLTDSLPDAGSRTVEVARAMADLDPSEPTRKRAVQALIDRLPKASHRTGPLAQTLVELAATEPTRQCAVQALIDRLPRARHRTGAIAQALVDLDPSESTRMRAVQALTDRLPNAGRRTETVTQALVGLATTEPTRVHAVRVLADFLPEANDQAWAVGQALVGLATTEATRLCALQALTDHLPKAGDRTWAVARALVRLDPSGTTQELVVQALVDHLPNAGFRTGRVARALVDLDPSEPTRERAVQALADRLPRAGSRTDDVAWSLAYLATSEPTRKRAVRALTDCLRKAGYFTAAIAIALVDLDPSEPTRKHAVQALTDRLCKADDRLLTVAVALVDLDPSEPTRKHAVQAVTERIPNAGRETAAVARTLRQIQTANTWLACWATESWSARS